MLQFWCLSPVKVACHSSFRENLESAFWGLGLSYHNLMKHKQVFKAEQLKCCSFDASPQSEWLITAHLERIWSQHFGALECHIAAWLGRCKSSKRAPLKCCSFDASPQSEWLITAHLERIWNQHFGALDCHITTWFWVFGVSHHNLIKDMQAFKTEQLKCCSFDASPQAEWLITAHLERIWSQIWGFGVSYRSLIRQMQVFKKGTSEILRFWCLSPVRVAYHGSFRENLESAFWGLGLSYVTSQLDETHSSLQSGAFEMLQF